MNREEAYELLHKYMKGENYIQHSMAVEAIMRGLAKRLAPEDVEYWGIAGLLHDLGNPPFGHFGETVIGDWFKENGGTRPHQREYTA